MSALDLAWVGVVVAYVGPVGPATPVVAEEPVAVAARGLVSAWVEAVALASGGSRQMAGVAAMLQLVIPLVVFALLRAWQSHRFGRFAGMRAGGLQ